MRTKKNQHSEKTVRFALFFFLFIFLVIIGSFIIKGVSLVQSSLFDGEHRFSILFQSDNKTERFLLSVSPQENTISVFRLYGEGIKLLQEFSVHLGIPIDAFVEYRYRSPFSPLVLKDLVFDYRSVKTNMTFLDVVRLWMFVKRVPTYNITEKTYSFSSSEADLDKGVLDSLMSSLFTDTAISEEKRSIHIINSSGVSGLGNRVARIVTNMGGNVVAVSTGDSVLPVSEIMYSDEESYTLEKLQRIFRSKAVNTHKQAISDIVVIVGKDKSPLFTIQQ